MSACSVQVNTQDRWSDRIECQRGTFWPIDAGHDRSETCNVGGVSVRVASIADLIFLKRLADRPRDRDDIEKLETIARLKGTL